MNPTAYGSQIRPGEHAVPVVEREEEISTRDWPPAKKGKGAPKRPPNKDRRKSGRT